MEYVYEHFEAPGAAFPSSHVAVALCTLYFSFRYLPRIRILHTVTVILMSMATVYCRYHYVADVIAGALAAALLIPLGNWLHGRFGKAGFIPDPNPEVEIHLSSANQNPRTQAISRFERAKAFSIAGQSAELQSDPLGSPIEDTGRGEPN